MTLRTGFRASLFATSQQRLRYSSSQRAAIERGKKSPAAAANEQMAPRWYSAQKHSPQAGRMRLFNDQHVGGRACPRRSVNASCDVTRLPDSWDLFSSSVFVLRFFRCLSFCDSFEYWFGWWMPLDAFAIRAALQPNTLPNKFLSSTMITDYHVCLPSIHAG